MNEIQIIVLLASGGILWAAGGTWWKGFRRFLLPVVAVVTLAATSIGLIRAVLCGLTIALSAALPYGDRTPWPVRVLVFLAIPAPALVVNAGVWPYVLGAGLLIIGGATLTRNRPEFTHKIWEFCAGVIQAGVIVISVLQI